MSTSLKIYGGTTPSERLCDTCTHAHIFQGEAVSDTVICTMSRSLRVPLKVVRCNSYHDKRDKTPPLRTMMDMAFILTEQGPLKNIGFIPARKWKEAHKDERMLPGHGDYPWDD